MLLQANTGNGWGYHSNRDTMADLDFKSGLLRPDHTVFAPIALRIAPDAATNGHHVRVYLRGAAIESGTLGDYLYYTVKAGIPPHECGVHGFAQFGEVPLGFPAMSPLNTGSGEHYLLIEEPSQVLELCIAVSLPLDTGIDARPTRGSAHWEFTGQME